MILLQLFYADDIALHMKCPGPLERIEYPFIFVSVHFISPTMALEKVPEVDIDANGVFKYVLIELKDKQGLTKTIVRGYEWAEYHADILDRVAPRLCEKGLTYDCVGGGRIRHESNTKTLYIYGYSVGFGQANHRITVDIFEKELSPLSSGQYYF
ncbi:14 kDa phosphohistidine phosphatase-like [Gigantopelta aegis]|uniref:14 kDa phosphohistidine phosphatase-like n=1 Tax=Gigantopelta aegis TaxID=1735272 RepID=UPI001B8880E5|nr:14 kDa phosphohistidine phosphatase-like [Gigantopelta aegis]